MLDISASREGRATLMDTVSQVVSRLFIPLTVGCGVRTLDDARRLLAAGADKVAVNTAAVETPELVSELAARYGRQAVVVAIDARRQAPRLDSLASSGATVDDRYDPGRRNAPEGQVSTDTPAGSRWKVLTYGGTHETDLEAVEWSRRVEALGAGEILLTSMDADGTQAGFDCELTRVVAQAVHIPVIASGGAGTPEHIAEVFLRGAADAALAASIFHFGMHTIRILKEYLRTRGVPVRLVES
jgi:cyclase